MIIADALRSLRQKFSQAFFFWLTFVLCTVFIFLFFNISMSDAIGVVFINSKADLATNLTILVIAFCSINIFFANDFFARSKTRELAVRIVSGATYIQLAFYLLVQTFILLILAVPAGIFLAYCILPLLNSLLAQISGTAAAITIRMDAVFTTSIVLLFLIFWTTLLNMSLAYKNSASALLNERRMKLQFDSFIKPSFSFSDKALRILYTVMVFAPVILMFINPYTGLFLSVIALIGFNGFLPKVFVPWLNDHIRTRSLSDPDSAAALGFYRNDLQILKNNLLLYYVNSVFLLTLVIGSHENAMETMMVFVSYAFMNILQSLTMMFKYSSEISDRTAYYASLDQIGYTRRNFSRIIFREVSLLYGSAAGLALLYDLSMLSGTLRIGDMSLPAAAGLTACVIVPVLFCWLISLLHYRRTILSSRQQRRRHVY